jgi:hypothetical protein
MKKSLYLLITFSLVFISCSSDDNTSDPASTTLVKKIVIKSPNDFVLTQLFTYDGNKIKSINGIGGHGDFTEKFTYTNNDITKSEGFDKNNKLIGAHLYTYENRKLATSTHLGFDGSIVEKYYYTYNNDNTISFRITAIDDFTKMEKDWHVGKLFLSNGNVVKEERKLAGEDDTYLSTTTYEYDSKNSPYKNIVGFLSLRPLNFYRFFSYSGPNNVTKFATWNVSVGISYTYDVNGFPLKQVKQVDLGENNVESIEYFY